MNKEERAHKKFVLLASTFSHIKPAISRLKKVLEEQDLVVHPKKEVKLKARSTLGRISLNL